MTRHPKYLVAAILLSVIFSPFVETVGGQSAIPEDNIHLVDPRLDLVFQNPERSQELGIAPAPAGKISLIAQVRNLDHSHHLFVETLGGEITSNFPRFNTFGFLLPMAMVPDVTYLPDLIWLEADVLFYPSLDNSVDSIGAETIWADFGIRGEGTTIAILDTGVPVTESW